MGIEIPISRQHLGEIFQSWQRKIPPKLRNEHVFRYIEDKKSRDGGIFIST